MTTHIRTHAGEAPLHAYNPQAARFPPRDTTPRMMDLAIEGIEKVMQGERPAGCLQGWFATDLRRIPQPYRTRLLDATTAVEAFGVIRPLRAEVDRDGTPLPCWLALLDAFAFDASGRMTEPTDDAEAFFDALHNAAVWIWAGKLPAYCRRTPDKSPVPRRWLDRRVAPWGYWTEADGSQVTIDGFGRTLCRRHASGVVEHLAPDTRIEAVSETPFGEGDETEEREAQRLAVVIEECGLADEIERRCVADILSKGRGGLPLPKIRY